jgi:anthranilate phosphoribosyltransferase
MSDEVAERAFAALGGWPGVLGRLLSGRDLTGDEAGCALGQVLSGAATASQIAAFVMALRMKGETVDEMAGLVRAMLAHAELLSVPGDLVDTCGTGGDRSGSVNVSTLAAFVVAGAGARVCKHGGRAASSSAGSADVLEALGVVIDLGPQDVARCIGEAGMGFCFAPRYHPAMRFAAPVRRELGVATVFNFLGPLANPARARHQVVGVSDPAMAEKMVGVLVANGARRAMVVYGADGLDEMSTTAPTTVLEVGGRDTGDSTCDAGLEGSEPATRTEIEILASAAIESAPATGPPVGREDDGCAGPQTRDRSALSGVDGQVGLRFEVEVRRYSVDATDLGLPRATLADLRGGDAAANAEVVRRVLDGGGGPHRDVVVLNAAAGLVVADLVGGLEEGVEMAGAVIDDGRARAVLDRLVRVSQEAASA